MPTETPSPGIDPGFLKMLLKDAQSSLGGLSDLAIAGQVILSGLAATHEGATWHMGLCGILRAIEQGANNACSEVCLGLRP